MLKTLLLWFLPLFGVSHVEEKIAPSDLVHNMHALGSLYDFPAEVLLEVLKRLDPRDVLRCRRVRYWLYRI